MASVQADVIENLGSALDQLGPLPGPQDRKTAFQEVLKCTDSYNYEQPSTRRPYDESLVRVVREGSVDPKRLQDVAGPEARPMIENPELFILKTDKQLAELLEEEIVIPYSDPALGDPAVLQNFMGELSSAGVLSFRKRCRSKVGVFFVVKKDGSLRLVVDCRAVRSCYL